MCFRSPYRTFRHLAIQQSFITRTISLHRPASEPSTRYRRPFHASTTACAADSPQVASGGNAAKDEKETSQNNERVKMNSENTPWDNSIHIVRQKETPKKEETSPEEGARRLSSILDCLAVGCVAFSLGYISRSCSRAETHCDEGDEKEFLQILTPPEKIKPDNESFAEDRYRAFVKRARKQELECKGISERASLRCIDNEKALLLRKALELDVKLGYMEKCPATKRFLRREKKVLQERISELEQMSEAMKVEFNLSTARKMDLWAREDRAVLVTQLTKVLRSIEDCKTRPTGPHEVTLRYFDRQKKSLEKELKDLDESDVKLKAIINAGDAATEPDSDCRCHKIKADIVGEVDGRSTERRPRDWEPLVRNGLIYGFIPPTYIRKSMADSLGGAQFVAYEKSMAAGGDLSCCEGTSLAKADIPRKDKVGDENDDHNAVTDLANQRLGYGKVAAVIGLSLIVANGALR